MHRSPEGWSRGIEDLSLAAAAGYVALWHGLWQHRQHVRSQIGASKARIGVRVGTAEQAGEIIPGGEKWQGEGSIREKEAAQCSNTSPQLQHLQPPDISSPLGGESGSLSH